MKSGTWLLRLLRLIVSFREFSLIAVLVLFGGFMTIQSDVFLTKANLEAILLGLSVEGIIAVGMVILLISGGLDLSVGSTLALTGVVTGLALMKLGLSPLPAITLGLLAALAVGLINGLLVSKLKINPFITTLGMMITVRGLLLVLAEGRAVLNLPETFTVVGQGRLFGIQYPIYVMLLLVIVGDLLMRYSRFFRQSYYIGGNEKAARFQELM